MSTTKYNKIENNIDCRRYYFLTIIWRDTMAENIYKCEYCSKVFDNYRKLNGHKRIHVPANNIPLSSRKHTIPLTKCKHCQMAIPSRNTYCNNKCQKAFEKQLTFEKVEKGEANSRHVKIYLIEKHGEICMDPECAWDFSKRPIKVELEHIDGNSENNNLSNCKLLCPNCHSMTSTYKSKNKGNGRHSRRLRYSEDKSY